MKQILLGLFLICSLFACNSSDKPESPKPTSNSFDSLQVENMAANEPTNGNLRKVIASKGDSEIDKKAMDSILNVLDSNGFTFCEMVNGVLSFEDSLYAIAKQKYPDPLDQENYGKLVDLLISDNEPKYLKRFGLPKKYVMYSTFITAADSDLKNFCSSK